MARQTNKLTARTVANLSKPGRHSDGGNLYLFIDDDGRRRWIFRFVRNGRAREMGLGGYPATSLGIARQKAEVARKALAQGGDLLATKKAAHKALIARRTFGQCAAELHASKAAGWRNEKHAAQWRQTLETHAKALGGDRFPPTLHAIEG
jgi:Arm DNA-binding domain